MRYLMAKVVFDHCQRPGVVENMTLHEAINAKECDDKVVILVAKHKTGASGPAALALEAEDYKLFQLYIKRLDEFNKKLDVPKQCPSCYCN